MAEAFVTSSSGSNLWDSDTSETLVLSMPTGLVTGNVLYAIGYATCISAGTGVSSWTAPSGWTVQSQNNDTTDRAGSIIVLTRTVTGSEASTYNLVANFNNGSTLYFGWAVLQYSGVDTTSPIDGTPGYVQVDTASTITAPSISPTGSTDIQVAAFFVENTATFSGSPSGFTQRETSAGRPPLIVYDKTLSASGATATVSQNISSSFPGAAVTFALTPAAPVVTGTASLSLSGAGVGAAADTASGSLTLSGTASHGVAASATATLSLAGSATAGTAAGASLSLSGSAVPTRSATGTARLTLSGSGAGHILTPSTSQPDNATDDSLSNQDGFRLLLEWSAVVEFVHDQAPTYVENDTAIQRVSLAMAAPSIDSDTGYPGGPWAYTETREDWGHLHLSIGHKSFTHSRNHRFIPVQDAHTEPFGDESATFRLPGLTEFDDPAALGLTPLAPVRFYRRDPDGNDTTLYEGSLASLEPDEIQTDETSPGMVVQCVGAIYRLDLLKERPALYLAQSDLGHIIAHAFNARRRSFALNIGHMPQRHLGIPATRSQDFSNLITGAIQDYLSQATSDDGQWTIHLDRPRTPVLRLKDTTTVHVTVTYGQPGVVVNVSKDYTAATTAIYASGTNGHSAWMGARFPNLTEGDTPTFPLGVGGVFLPGDGQTGFAPFAAYLRRGAYGGIASDDTYDAADENNVIDFQTDAGVTADGQVGAQAWEAAFQPGANQGTIQGARVGAIVSRPETHKYLHNAQGARTGRNPDFDPAIKRVEDYIPFGDGVSKGLAKHSAHQVINRSYPAQRSGEIVLTADPEEKSRFTVKAGENILVKHYNGSNLLLHISRRERDWTTGTVTLTVDERANDELTAAAIHQRNKEVSDLTRRKRFGHNRSHVWNDYGPWLEEDGAGEIPLMYQQAGRWNTQRIPASPSGTLERIVLAAGTGLTEHILNQAVRSKHPPTVPGAARTAILITGQPIHPNAIARLTGMSTPLTELDDGSNPWDRNHSVLHHKFQMIYAAGGPGNACGFFPHTDPGDGTDTDLTGLFEDGGAVTFGPTGHFWLWVSIWSPVDCIVGGKLFPGPPG